MSDELPSTMATTEYGDFDSFSSPYVTYTMDKFSCVADFYFAHVVFCYGVFLSGAAALLTRVVPGTARFHHWCGRSYIVCMIWATATSLLVHNTGLPLAVLLSFVWVLGGLTLGWLAAALHALQANRQAANLLQERLLNGTLNNQQGKLDLLASLNEAKVSIASSKSFRTRLFSWKTLHGLLMFTSWINITGRIFASDQSGNFTCHTYPVYKPINTTHGNFSGVSSLEELLVPGNDPEYSRLPWSGGITAWGAILFFAPMAVGLIVAGPYSYFVSWRASKAKTAVDSMNSPLKPRNADL